jgi:hypothetical protein
MVANKSQNSPLCHRCNQRMTFRTSEVVAGKQMQIYECEICKTLEANDPIGRPGDGAQQPTL